MSKEKQEKKRKLWFFQNLRLKFKLRKRKEKFQILNNLHKFKNVWTTFRFIKRENVQLKVHLLVRNTNLKNIAIQFLSRVIKSNLRMQISNYFSFDNVLMHEQPNQCDKQLAHMVYLVRSKEISFLRGKEAESVIRPGDPSSNKQYKNY
jgi:hypothetical protein